MAIEFFDRHKHLEHYSDDDIVSVVAAKVPDAIWDRWEGAYEEINRIIQDAKLEYDRQNKA